MATLIRSFAHLLALAALIAGAAAQAQPAPPEPVKPAARASLPLFAGPCQDAEQWDLMFGQINVRNVTCPKLYPVLPRAGRANGKAVIVVPGGGYRFVSIEMEGFRLADALAARGYTAFVLKYRTIPAPREGEAYAAQIGEMFASLGKRELEDYPPAVDDLAAALRLIRGQASGYPIDRGRIGVIGFSAGARTAIRLIEGKEEARLIENAALIYPPMLHPVKGGPRPALFLGIAVDDPLFRQGGLGLLQGWQADSPRFEAHFYANGSHGFGMGTKGTTSDLWLDQYLAWLDRH